MLKVKMSENKWLAEKLKHIFRRIFCFF